MAVLRENRKERTSYHHPADVGCVRVSDYCLKEVELVVLQYGAGLSFLLFPVGEQ